MRKFKDDRLVEEPAPERRKELWSDDGKKFGPTEKPRIVTLKPTRGTPFCNREQEIYIFAHVDSRLLQQFCSYLLLLLSAWKSHYCIFLFYFRIPLETNVRLQTFYEIYLIVVINLFFQSDYLVCINLANLYL